MIPHTTRFLLLALLLPFLASAASFEEGLRLKREQKLPQAEAAFAEVVQQNPSDVEALAELATVQGWQDRHAEAAASWRRALALKPDAIDLRIGLARLLYWSGQRGEALAELERALDAQPEHYDALLLRGDVLIAENDRTGARASYERATKLPPGNDDRDLAGLIARTAAPLRWRLDSGYAYERYNNARGTESGAYLQAGRTLGDRFNAYVRWDRLDQFDSTDNRYLLGAYFSPTPSWLISAEAGGTPDADFRPRQQAQTTVEWLRQGRWQPLLGYRYFGYAFGEVHTLTPGVRIPGLGPGDFELRYAWSRNTDESKAAVASARYGWTAGRFGRYIAIYDGEEALPPQAEANFTSYAAGCVLNLGRNWATRIDYAYENRRDFYIHHTAALGLSYRF